MNERGEKTSFDWVKIVYWRKKPQSQAYAQQGSSLKLQATIQDQSTELVEKLLRYQYILFTVNSFDICGSYVSVEACASFLK